MTNSESRRRRFRVRIDGRPLDIDDPRPRGRDLLEAAGLHPVDEHVLFFREPGGMFEDINLAEPVDLDQAGVEEFISAKADRLYFLVIDGRRYPWGKNTITGLELRELARIDEDLFLFFDPKGGKDDLVEDDEAVSLEGKDVERFFSTDAPPNPVYVYVELNGEKVRILAGDYTTETLKDALKVSTDWDLDIVDRQGGFRTLQPGENIRIVKRKRFVSHVRQGGSS